MHFIKLDAVQLNREAAWVADGELLLHSEVRHDGAELHDSLTEFQTRFDAFTTTQQCCTTTALSDSQHQAPLILLLSQHVQASIYSSRHLNTFIFSNNTQHIPKLLKAKS